MEEAAKTLEQWLKDASLRAEGESAERIRELLEESEATRVVERMERIGELYVGGQKPEARREAKELSRSLEVLARQLDVLHRGIVAPELAKLVEFDRRVAELTARLKDLKTDAEITEWHRQAAALVRDLEKAGLTDGAKAAGRCSSSGTVTDPQAAAGLELWVDTLRRSTRLSPGQDPGPDPQGHGVGPRRGDTAGVQGAGRALLRGALEKRRQPVKQPESRSTRDMLARAGIA